MCYLEEIYDALFRVSHQIPVLRGRGKGPSAETSLTWEPCPQVSHTWILPRFPLWGQHLPVMRLGESGEGEGGSVIVEKMVPYGRVT